MKYIVFPILFLLPIVLSAQDAELNKVIKEINFGQDTVESVFLWVADNIKYDIKRKDEIVKQIKSREKQQGSRSDFENEMLRKVLTTKKGVCQDYSILMNSILEKLGFTCKMVKGYTRNNEGKINTSLGHTWNAIKVGNEWRLYDPTWAAGYIKEGSKFVKKYNPKWNNISPEEMIKTHMPCDPIWQLMSRPISYDDFKISKFNRSESSQLDYENLINQYFEKLSSTSDADALARSKTMGKANAVVKRWQSFREKTNEYIGKKNKSDQFTIISNEMNQMINTYNEYVSARNKNFKTKNWDLEKSFTFLSQSKEKCLNLQEYFQNIEIDGAKEKSFVTKSKNSLKKFIKLLGSELKFVEGELRKLK